ncbi:hypothetical protein [Acetomicrobium sp.]|uniref:hypothetical protein n=1 Tax=Acetomicrobium sp. TaxID=1872099 RepID=UPI0028714351|nr:hypothetical protein [Acetomicrobium sp.]MDR9769423.1 hypothetical protein [Acetomicrobium sp.]
MDLKAPIHDICGLLEKAGIKILILPIASEGFFGLSINDKDRDLHNLTIGSNYLKAIQRCA